jgi:hypothetical protein
MTALALLLLAAPGLVGQQRPEVLVRLRGVRDAVRSGEHARMQLEVENRLAIDLVDVRVLIPDTPYAVIDIAENRVRRIESNAAHVFDLVVTAGWTHVPRTLEIPIAIEYVSGTYGFEKVIRVGPPRWLRPLVAGVATLVAISIAVAVVVRGTRHASAVRSRSLAASPVVHHSPDDSDVDG